MTNDHSLLRNEGECNSVIGCIRNHLVGFFTVIFPNSSSNASTVVGFWKAVSPKNLPCTSVCTDVGGLLRTYSILVSFVGNSTLCSIPSTSNTATFPKNGFSACSAYCFWISSENNTDHVPLLASKLDDTTSNDPYTSPALGKPKTISIVF